jgi:lipopolysaccharide transport system permease protein
VSAEPRPTVVIEATPDTIPARLVEVWRYRKFFSFLFKEITGRRARGTLLGWWWLILRPLIPAAIMIFAFSAVRPVDTGSSVPYALFFLSGYIPFTLFQMSMRFLPRTLGWTRSIMSKTYFPRLLVPMAGFGNPGIYVAVLVVAFIVITAAITWNTGTMPLQLGWRVLWVIPALVQTMMFSLAIGMVLGVVALFFRDIIFTARFGAMIFLVVTPVIWPIDWIPAAWRWLLYALNPMAQAVLVSRWALTGDGVFEPGFAALSFGTTTVMLLVATVFFLRAERLLGDQM